MEMSSSLSSSMPSAVGGCSSVPSIESLESKHRVKDEKMNKKESSLTWFASRFFRRFARTVIRDVILTLAMDIEPAIAALEALLEEALQQFATVMTHGRLRVRMDDESVRNFDPAGHLLFDPKGPAGANRRPSMFLYIRTGATAGQTVRHTL